MRVHQGLGDSLVEESAPIRAPHIARAATKLRACVVRSSLEIWTCWTNVLKMGRKGRPLSAGSQGSFGIQLLASQVDTRVVPSFIYRSM